jgi:hypothetical protein
VVDSSVCLTQSQGKRKANDLDSALGVAGFLALPAK